MKNIKINNFILLIFCTVSLLFIQTIAYSALSSTMKITGNAYARVDANVRITNFRLGTANKATSFFEKFGKDHVITGVELLDTSSTITYYVEITNYGNVDVGIYNINGLPSEVNYTINDYNLKEKICDDNGKCNGFIKKTYEITLTTTSAYNGNIQMNFEFKSFCSVTYTGITNQNYISSTMDGEDLNITFVNDIPNRINIYVDGIEIDRSAYSYNNTTGKLVYKSVSGNMVIEKAESTLLDGQEFSVKLKNFVNGTNDAEYNSSDSTVTYIGIYEDKLPEGYSPEQFFSLPYLEASNNARIKAYNDNGKIFIYSIDDILAPADSYSLFRGYTSLKELNILELDTSKVISAQSIFDGLQSLEYLDLSNFVTNNINHMQSMFSNCSSLINIDVSHFDTSRVRSFQSMFSNNKSLIELDVSSFDTSKADTMLSMFQDCTNLKTIKFGAGWDTSNVTNMSGMFAYCLNLETIDISMFNTSKVTNMSRMFRLDPKLENIYVGDGWDISLVTDSEKMFLESAQLPNYNSNYIDVTKAYVGDGGYLKQKTTFKIQGETYIAEKNQTWADWIASDYNTLGLIDNNGYVYTSDYLKFIGTPNVGDGYTYYSYTETSNTIDDTLHYMILADDES